MAGARTNLRGPRNRRYFADARQHCSRSTNSTDGEKPMFGAFARVLPVLVLTSGIAWGQTSPVVSRDVASHMPPNPEKIAASLVKRGVIPATASLREIEAAVESYLRLKMSGGGPDQNYNPLARKRVNAAEEALNAGSTSAIRGRKLGNTLSVPPSSPQWKSLAGTGKLLVILVEFSNTPYTWQPVEGPQRTEAGPLHNQIPVPDNTFDLWVPDFSAQHYEDMLFTPGGWTIPAGDYAGERRGSMRDYFLEQSYGRYTVGGDVYGWYTVDKPEAYYGDDRPSGGHDNLLPGNRAALVEDTVAVIGNAIDWEAYDADGDCLIDHPLFIHAGIDQSGGGGVQGDDALWAHSSSVFIKLVDKPACLLGDYGLDGIYLYNYTMMPEDGGVGVFAHEFGHDLGLPDEYDTAYSGRGDSVAFWSLMSYGSWVGWPAQTQPSDMSIWGRYALGWVQPGDNLAVTNLTSLASLGKTPLGVRLEQAERWGGEGTYNAIRVNLPPKLLFVNTPHSGAWEWWGGKADLIDTTLRRTVDLTGKTSATLSFWTWYDIEPLWDFGFVQVSTDGGATWTSLPISGTTTEHDPSAMASIVANLPGFTGNSGGWVYKTYDMSAYAGQSIQLQFRYMTDWGTTMAGFYVDDISVQADGTPLFFDDVETVDPAWTAAGWTRDNGSTTKTHYYLLEWRNGTPMETTYDGTTILNFDAGLSSVYQYDPYGSTGNPNEPWHFSYSLPGLLLWYRDMSYTDNWTGSHPGHGFLLVVDAHKQAMLRPPLPGGGSWPWFSQVQSYDATFGLSRAPDALLGYWGIVRNYAGLNAIPNFDDSLSYWSSTAPAASVKTPTYGLLFRVLGQATDGSATIVGLGLK